MNSNIWPLTIWAAALAAMWLASRVAHEPYARALRVGAAAGAASLVLIYAAAGIILVVTA